MRPLLKALGRAREVGVPLVQLQPAEERLAELQDQDQDREKAKEEDADQDKDNQVLEQEILLL